MTAIAYANSEPMPGYVLTERIGSGGYGEVWRATAPGGVEKAVKALFGYHDEELASRELKALERIKGVRHPFLLAIDRFEVVDGRLIVVTELADMSLDQCFQKYRRQSYEGIPAEELLGYLRDAADALDYMQEKHSLQHLDVKPENLLILGGHTKVADFGLVKDVTRQTQNSLVGGMTPTYAAPEVFDNRPGPRTDQYSLAIVYQEMLTGSLPFPGKTPAQLVAQHLQGRPRVSTLPACEQPIVLRALAKDAKDRFESCRAFVEALTLASDSGAAGSAPTRATERDASDSAALDDTHNRTDSCTEPTPGRPEASREGCTEPLNAAFLDEAAAAGGSSAERPPAQRSPFARDDEIRKDPTTGPLPPTISISVSSRVVDATIPDCKSAPEQLRKTLLIGVGGAGGSVLRRVCNRLTESDPEAPWREITPMLAIDTDVEDLKSLRQHASERGPSFIDSVVMPLKRPQQYRDHPAEVLQWLSRRWLYNVPRSLKTRGYRPLGRLALIDNAEAVVAEIQRKLRAFVPIEGDDLSNHRSAESPERPRVIVVASTSGGTGSGTALDIAYAVRRIAQELQLTGVEVVGVFGDCHGRGGEANKLSLANTYSFFAELATVCESGNRSQNPPLVLDVFEGDGPPLDHIYFASSIGEGSVLDAEEWIEQTALYLATGVGSQAGQRLAACRDADPATPEDPVGGPLLRSFAAASLDESRTVLERRAREQICRVVADQWRRPVAASLAASDAPADESSAPDRSQGRRSKRAHNAKVAKPATPAEEALDRARLAMEEKFGDVAQGAFAEALLEALLHRIEEKPGLVLEEYGAAFLRLVHRSADVAVQELNDVVCRLRDDDDAEKVVSARCLGSDALTDEGDQANPLSEASQAIARDVSRRAQRQFFTPLLASAGKNAPDLGELLWLTTGEVLDGIRCKPGMSEEILNLAGPSADTVKTAEQTAVRPHRCGHVRRTLVVAPENWRQGMLESVVRDRMPNAAYVTSRVASPVLIREAAELSLYQVASRLQELQPDVRAAATRLHTRADIEWSSLMRVVTVDD